MVSHLSIVLIININVNTIVVVLVIVSIIVIVNAVLIFFSPASDKLSFSPAFF